MSGNHRKKVTPKQPHPYGIYLGRFLFLGGLILFVGVMTLIANGDLPETITDSLLILSIVCGFLGFGYYLGIRPEGIKRSLAWYGKVCIFCGAVGLLSHYLGWDEFSVRNEMFQLFAMVSDLFGSLLVGSLIAIIIGVILILIIEIHNEYLRSKG